MKYFLISDNTDSATGMRLAGVEGVVVAGREEALRALRDAAGNPDIGIILVTEKLCALLEDEIEKIRNSDGECLIVGIPDRHGRQS
ncbi:MAG: V-type ATP synthase subunit F [Clostridia bacterium]|nr:V-type ATP synthase subunit F [Clostridia bacterium]